MSSRLPEVTAKVDAFFARVAERHGDDMQCASGCADCCRVRLSITRAEADAIRALAADRTIVANPAPDRCAALDAGDRCQIYEARPVVCRSHGAPIRLGALRVIETCPKNFRHTTPDPDCVLDQTTLSALTLAVNREAGHDDARIELADLIAELSTVSATC